MEKIVLSLKNLYMVLMSDDFPMYSESVIGRNERKGQTMLRFWQSMIVEEFRSKPCGRVIWRNDSKRNRYISYVCNRNPAMKTYSQYAQELASEINTTTLMNQIARFEDFLASKKYRYDIFLRRIQELLRLVEAEDPYVSTDIAAQLRNAAEVHARKQDGAPEKLFRSAYVMTLLTIYAAAGDAMSDPVLAVLRSDAYSLPTLWQARREKWEQKSQVEFLTVHCGILQDNPLPRNHFFGREEALFDLQEMASSGRKCIISGIGGIGKTELLRQLLCVCAAEQLADAIAVIPYETGITESFVKAFPNLFHGNSEQAFRQALYRITQAVQNGRRVLILIDDLIQGQEDPALKELLKLPCSVLITTRRTSLEGFDVYPLDMPSRSTSSLIFRDNYRNSLSREDQALLNDLLESPSLRHPLTLQLLARAAASKRWSLVQLREYLRQKKTTLTWTEEERTVRLNQLYSQLYSLSRVPKGCQSLIELFTLLPGGSYSRAFLEEVFPELLPEDSLTHLENLVAQGWLNAGNDGYSMHPFVAQCLRRKVITEAKIKPVLTCLHRQLPDGGIFDANICYSEVCRRAAEILIYISGFVAGSISKTLMLDIITAMGVGVFPRDTVERYEKYLAQLMKRCTQQDDLVEIRYRTIISNWYFVNVPTIRKLYEQQKAAPTVSRQDFIIFCLSAAPTIMYAEPEFSVELISNALTTDARPDQYALACYYMAAVAYHTGNTEGAIHWSKTGTEYALSHPECGKDLLFSNMAYLCMHRMRIDRYDEVEAHLQQLKELLGDHPVPIQQINYFSRMAQYFRGTGRPEEALNYYRKSLSMIPEHLGIGINYYSMHVTMGMVYKDMKQYDRAMELFRIALAYFREDGDSYYCQTVLNNMANVYLEQNMPKEALSCLEEFIEDARKMKGMAHGEPCLTMAKAYRMLGGREKEYALLQEAQPHLASTYGDDHFKVVEIRQRLAELETQLKEIK